MKRTLGGRKGDKGGKYCSEFGDIVAWLQKER